MVYRKPAPHRCDKCGYEWTISPDNIAKHLLINLNDMYCPECWKEFHKTIGVLKRVGE